MYKHNLGILNNRYGEFERSYSRSWRSQGNVFLLSAQVETCSLPTPSRMGFFEDKHVQGLGLDIVGDNGFCKSFPMSFTY
jgi:hypothetical protein